MQKLSRGSLAVLLLALMLALSMVVGITGAWFTSSAEKHDEYTFGAVTITLGTSAWKLYTDNSNEDGSERDSFIHPSGVSYATGTEIMPGDDIKFEGNVANSADAAYVFVKIVATNKDGALPAGTGGAAAPASPWAQLMDNAQTPAAVTGVYYVALDKAGESGDDADINLMYHLDGDVYVDAFENTNITVKIAFVAVQQANMANPYAAYDAAGVAATLTTLLG